MRLSDNGSPLPCQGRSEGSNFPLAAPMKTMVVCAILLAVSICWMVYPRRSVVAQSPGTTIIYKDSNLQVIRVTDDQGCNVYIAEPFGAGAGAPSSPQIDVICK
jgi:hypothetical protein